MIKLTWLELSHPNFQQALNAIFDCPNLDPKTSYTASRLLKAVEAANKDAHALRISLIDKYAQKDEKGKIIEDANRFVKFEKDEDRVKFEEEFTKEFGKRTVELQVSKLPFQSLTPVRGITARSWEFLAPVVDGLPEENEEDPLQEKMTFPVNIS